VAKEFTSVWMREPRAGRSAGLTREQIVRAAVELLDAEGLDALSMRKLGARLGAGATSLYWHVANKDELLELALDEIWGLVEMPDPARASWREVVTSFVYTLRATMLAHPWVASLLGQMPSVGPQAFRLSDTLRRAFGAAGFTGLDIYLATGTVTSFVLGQVIPQIALARATGDEDGYDHASMREMVDRVAGDYPELADDYRKSCTEDPRTAQAVAFDFALTCVLDGLAARLPRD
jgi:AcrR family transcriptional regulator